VYTFIVDRREEVNMRYTYNDGGRSEAGFKGKTSDCVVRAISIITQKPYQEVYDAINELSLREHKTRHKGKSNSRTGVYRSTYHKYLRSLGYTWTPTMNIGSGCKTHLKEEELPSGKLIVKVSRHLTAVIDGVINDTFDPSRNGNRCVYGYYTLVGS
jgi:hypothetical protein